MFEFTTQSVYNNIIKATTSQIKSGTAPKGYNFIDNASPADPTKETPYIRVGNTRFDSGQIVKFDVRNPSKEYLASVTFDLQKVIAKIPEGYNEITGRIALYIGLSMNSQDSFYSNDFVYKGKPFFIEFPVKSTTTAKDVKKIVDKYLLLMTDEKILNVTEEGTEITFEGVNGYQQIRKAILQWFNPEAKTVDCCTNQGDYEDVVTGVPVMWNILTEDRAADVQNNITAASAGTLEGGNVYDGTAQGREIDPDTEVEILPGLEAFGDYNWIIHNLRLPTLANTHFWSPTKNEMPIPGQTYVQITITMRDTNKGTAGNDIGQVTTCQTTHVLYVAKDSQDLSDLIDSLTDIGQSKVTETGKQDVADQKFNDPFGQA